MNKTSQFNYKRLYATVTASGILLSSCLVVSEEISPAPEPSPIDTLMETQLDSLSPEFNQQFSTIKQLTAPKIREYASSHPREIVALRRYLTMLADRNIVSAQTVNHLISVVMDVANQQASTLAELPTVQTQKAPTQLPSDNAPKPVDLGISYTNQIRPETDQEALVVSQTELPTEENPFARAIALEELREKEKKERNIRLAAKIMSDLAQGQNRRQAIVKRVNRSISDFVEEESTKVAKPLLDNVEISINSNDGSAEYELRGLKALGDTNQLGFGFTEFGVNRSGDTTTLNIGVGTRVSDPNNLVMLGGNAVLDYEPGSKHQRLSLGLEAVSSPFQLYANRYYVLSDPLSLNGTTTEYALNGRDVKLQAAVPYLPQTYVGVTDFKYYGEDGEEDIKGSRYSVNGQLGGGWSLDIQRTDFSTGQDPKLSGKLSYNYIFGKSGLDSAVSATPFTLTPLPAHLKLDFIQRQNLIATQTSSAGLTVTFEKL
jgi:hypothetical protein